MGTHPKRATACAATAGDLLHEFQYFISAAAEALQRRKKAEGNHPGDVQSQSLRLEEWSERTGKPIPKPGECPDSEWTARMEDIQPGPSPKAVSYYWADADFREAVRELRQLQSDIQNTRLAELLREIDPTTVNAGAEAAKLLTLLKGIVQAIEMGTAPSRELFMQVDEWKERFTLPTAGGEPVNGSETADRVAQLPNSQRKAYLGFHLAKAKLGRKLSDRDAHDFLREYETDVAAECEVCRNLPSLDSFARYLRDARKALGDQKNSPRAGRTPPGSPAGQDE